LRWQSRITLARAAIGDWLKEPNVHVTLAECVYGSRGYNLADLAGARVTHIPLRATTMAWSKECLLNIAISRLPPGAEKIATFDIDVTFRRAGWTTEALAALDLYPVIQPWDTAYDLGPHDEHIQTHKSFASVWHAGKPVVAKGDKFWQFNGGYAVYPHSGYAWAWTRRARPHRRPVRVRRHGLRRPSHGARPGRRGRLLDAGRRRRRLSRRREGLGVAHGRGNQRQARVGARHDRAPVPRPRKTDRGYLSRRQMFLDNGFDPHTDLKRNACGVLEFAGNKPDLERAFDRYLRSREEDVNTLT
jgi:hypothetical protein